MECDNPQITQPAVVSPYTWRCLVCQTPSNQIQVLPCQHKFCHRCLELWAGIYVDMYRGARDQFPCQVCWKLNAFPNEGLKAFEQDYQVKLLEDSLQNMCMDQSQSIGTMQDPGQFKGQSGPFGYQCNNTTISNQCLPERPAESTMTSIMNADSFGQRIINTSSPVPGFIPNNPIVNQDPMLESASMENTNLSSNTTSINNYDAPCEMLENQTAIVHSPGGSAYPSMVSHMAPPSFANEQETNVNTSHHNRGPGYYCYRSHQLSMHLM